MSQPASSHQRRRLKAEARFVWYGRLALFAALALLALLLATLMARGVTGFMQVQLRVPVALDAAGLALEEGEKWQDVPPHRFALAALQGLKTLFPDAAEGEERELQKLLSGGAGVQLRERLRAHPEGFGRLHYVWLPASSRVDRAVKTGRYGEAGLSERQHAWLEKLQAESGIRTKFNRDFFLRGDSRQPEQAGFLGAIAGSLLTVLVCLSVAFPLGVMTAVYLEEFAGKSRWVEWVEININNLAAVPSIVFGLLGLAVYLNFFGLPRSAPLVGGLTLALMILPVIIISTRTALSAVPESIRHGALALGASPLQVVWHHTLPLALPGIMTGVILGIARAMGETAPLLMIGMVAFVVDVPRRFTDPATVMPVQVYLWAGSPEAGFAEKTAAGILVLLVVLLALNALAIYIRRRFEVRW